jgi:translation initiation factor 3 subunit B
MTKISGKKKSTVLMLFRVAEPEVPVELLELHEAVLDVQWEPAGVRFCVVHGEARSPTISFYTMGVAAPPVAEKKGKKGAAAAPVVRELSLLFSLTGKQCNEVIWSPVGSIVAIAYIQQDSALFDLHDVDNNVTLASRRHDRCNRIVWDPSGRIIATATTTPIRQTAVRGQPDDGFNLYTFQGTPICQIRKEKLHQFAWRPRPKDVLTADQKKAVVKNLRKYEKMFDKEDKERKQKLSAAAMEERRRLAEDFFHMMSNKRVDMARIRQQRIALRDGYDSEDDSNYQVVVQLEETVVSSKEQIIA